jgi:hypothetical protein
LISGEIDINGTIINPNPVKPMTRSFHACAQQFTTKYLVDDQSRGCTMAATRFIPRETRAGRIRSKSQFEGLPKALHLISNFVAGSHFPNSYALTET